MSDDLGSVSVFRALGDPTRCQVVARLSRGRATASELAAPFSMALPSFMQHLGVLEDCGVVRSHKRGRVRTYWLDSERLAGAEAWLTAQRREWDERADRFEEYIAGLDEGSR